MFTIVVLLNHPPPNQQSDGFPLGFLLERPETANTQLKLRTNPPKIANKQNYEQKAFLSYDPTHSRRRG